MNKLVEKLHSLLVATTALALPGEAAVSEGAHDFITARREPELGCNVKGDRKQCNRRTKQTCRSLASLDRLFAQIKREMGKLDMVLANAGSRSTPLPVRLSYRSIRAIASAGTRIPMVEAIAESSSFRYVEFCREPS
jgi:NAD(P)-dependent dehydrogenase (short-subunit alcohol dehydrogenase family)